jgi:hypothetical protein
VHTAVTDPVTPHIPVPPCYSPLYFFLILPTLSSLRYFTPSENEQNFAATFSRFVPWIWDF